MFEAFQNSVRHAVEAVQEKYDGFTETVDKLNQDILEIRDVFVGIKNIVSYIFSFMGQETTILLFCTFLFLFVVNLIPFLFVSKKVRYFIGMFFGAYLSFLFDYTIWSLVKYILIMTFPLFAEYLLVLFFKTSGKSLWCGVKKILNGIKKMLLVLWHRIRKKAKKEEEDEKQVLK